jgi:hypothetical protein
LLKKRVPYFWAGFRQYETKLIFGTLFRGFFLVIHIPSGGWNIASLGRQRRIERNPTKLTIPPAPHYRGNGLIKCSIYNP